MSELLPLARPGSPNSAKPGGLRGVRAGQSVEVHRCDGHGKAGRPMSVGKNQLFRLKVKG